MSSKTPPDGKHNDDGWASLNESDDWNGDEATSRSIGRQREEPTGQSLPAAPADTDAQKVLRGPHLVVVAGPELGRLYGLDKDLIRVGRGQNNDIVLVDASVSREHAQLQRRADGIWVVDLQAGNGTFVQGARVQQSLLQPEEQVAFGHVRLQLRAGGQSKPSTRKATTAAPAQATAAASPARASAQAELQMRQGPQTGLAAARTGWRQRLQARFGAMRQGLPASAGSRRGAAAVAAVLLCGSGGLFWRNHQARAQAFAAVQAGHKAFIEHRWDDAEQAYVAANNAWSGYALAKRSSAMLSQARHDEEALNQLQQSLNKNDLTSARTQLVPLLRSPLSEAVQAAQQRFASAERSVLLAAEAALQARLPQEAAAALQHAGLGHSGRADAQAMQRWLLRLGDLAPLQRRARAWENSRHRAPSLWEQAASQSKQMRQALRVFKRSQAPAAAPAAQRALGRPQNAQEQAFVADLKSFAELWQTGLEEYHGKRAFAAIKVLTQAKLLAARLVGDDNGPSHGLDTKLADMYYVLGMQALANDKLPEAAEALHAALGLNPRHALSLKRMDELAERCQRMVDEADFMQNSHRAHAKDLLRQVTATVDAGTPLALRARKLLGSMGAD